MDEKLFATIKVCTNCDIPLKSQYKKIENNVSIRYYCLDCAELLGVI